MNPARFARGCKVLASLQYLPGQYVPHPRSTLRILKAPTPSISGEPTLEIEIGCLLALLDYRKPPSNDTSSILGSENYRYDIISQLAAKAGIERVSVDIEEYPVSYPITTEQGYVATMGRVAWDAGYVLWIDGSETLCARKVPIAPNRPDARITVGVQEVSLKAIAPDETPVELVRAVGVAPEVKPTVNPKTVYAISSDEEFNPSSLRSTVFLGFGTKTVSTHTNVVQPRGRVFPALYPGSTQSIVSTEEDNYWFYDDQPEGLLRYKKTIVRQPEGVIFPAQSPGSSILLDAKEIVTSYFYLDDATIRIETKTYEPAQLVIGTAPPYMGQTIRTYGMKLSEWETESWTKEGGVWVRSPEIRKYKRGEQSRAETTFSGSGSTTPPAPERRTEPFYKEERQFVGEAKFPPVVGSSFQEVSREYEVNYPVSNQHCEEHARLEGTLLHGRQARLNWTLPIIDAIRFYYQPLMVFDWKLPDGTVMRHLTDGMAFVHDPDRGIVGGDSINLGQVRRRSPATVTVPDGVQDGAEYLYPPFALATTLQGSINLTGSLFAPGYSFSMAANLIGAAQATGSLMVLAKLEGAIASDTTAVISLVADPLQATIASNSTAVLILLADVRLQGAIASDSTAVLMLSNDVRLSGAIASDSTAVLTLSKDARLQGAIASDTTAAIALATGSPGVALTYVSGGDANGLFYYRGTNDGASAWTNPHTAGRITVIFSSTFDPYQNIAAMVDRKAGTDAATGNIAGSWIKFDLGAGHSLVLNRYAVQTRSYIWNCPSAFKFRASNDNVNWVDLDSRSTPTWVAGQWNAYAVSSSTAYRYFQLLSTGPDRIPV